MQRKAAGAEPDTAAVHASAQRGIATAASPLPHAEMVQRLFGRHDVSGIKAHTCADAAASAGAMGAKAYATGDHVVLGGGADLHTVAHEAAHIVQQRGGVQLKGSVGEEGDAYERQADEVANLVVQGKSAEEVLDRCAPPEPLAALRTPGSGTVQRTGGGTAVVATSGHAVTSYVSTVSYHNATTSAGPSACTMSPHAYLAELRFQRAIVLASGPPSVEKFHVLDQIEREIAEMEQQIGLGQFEREQAPGKAVDEEGAGPADEAKPADLTNEAKPTGKPVGPKDEAKPKPAAPAETPTPAHIIEYKPPKGTPIYANQGWWKDCVNAWSTGLWKYPEDPTSINSVHFLEHNTVLKDGYHAYAYRVSDNKIAYTYTGTDASTNNVVAHSYLASGGDVYAAGMFVVQGGRVTSINSASGHYLPDPKVELDYQICEERQTAFGSLEVLRNKLIDLGMGTLDVIMLPFRHPNLVKQKIDCQIEQTNRQGGLSMPPAHRNEGPAETPDDGSTRAAQQQPAPASSKRRKHT